MATKRKMRPLYPHMGFIIRPVKVLADGSELVHCTERKTSISCGCLGNRKNGVITIIKDHIGHDPDDGLVEAKLARVELKEIAETSESSPRDLLHHSRNVHGVRPLMAAGSISALNRMISRAREVKCSDSVRADANIPEFVGKMTVDNDGEKFLIFDSVFALTGGRHVAFGNKQCLNILQTSTLLLSDGTFDVARDPFAQLWSLHGQFGDSTIPVVNVLMSSRSVHDYKFVIEQLRMHAVNWKPDVFIGDLEIGQCKAVEESFPGIQQYFCYFHLLQCWRRRLKILKIEELTRYGSILYEFWSLLKCLPFGSVVTVKDDFESICTTLPTPLFSEIDKFIGYIKKNYVGDRLVTPRFRPETWNVVSRTIRNLPRTTNTVESLHRNLERCVSDKKGRAPPKISDLLKCLRQEAQKLKFDIESSQLDPSYQVSSSRKIKDVAKDKRILSVLSGNITGLPFFKAMRAAKKYQ